MKTRYARPLPVEAALSPILTQQVAVLWGKNTSGRDHYPCWRKRLLDQGQSMLYSYRHTPSLMYPLTTSPHGSERNALWGVPSSDRRLAHWGLPLHSMSSPIMFSRADRLRFENLVRVAILPAHSLHALSPRVSQSPQSHALLEQRPGRWGRKKKGSVRILCAC